MVKPKNTLEKYKFLRLYDMDFGDALHTVKVLRRYKRKDVRYPLLRDLIVAYCRPFTQSKGDKINNDFLAIKFDTPEMKQLHDELLNIRKQLFAHTDLTFKKPNVSNWSTKSYKWFPMSFKGFDYNNLDNRLVHIKQLIEYVQSKLRKQIKKYEECF